MIISFYKDISLLP